MFRTTRWMAWVLFGLAVSVSNACGGDKDKGGSAGSGGASPDSGGSGGQVSGGSGGERAGSGGSGSDTTTGQPSAGGAGGAESPDDDRDAGTQTEPRGGSGGSAAEGGSGGTSAIGGTGGVPAGGSSGSVGTLETGGVGGGSESGGTGGASESGGAGGAAGSGGTGGASGSGEMDETAAQCVRDAEAAGQTISDCETCLCESDNCQTEMNAIKDDAVANALATCGKANTCAGQCCLCSTDGHGDTCNISNYATGVCADEVETAAGATPGAGLVNVGAVMANCTNSGPADNACARITRLETCAAAKCASECPRVVVACPPE